MSKTLADARAQTRMYLDEATQADWKDAEVDREINAGYHEVIATVMETYEDFYLSNTSLNTVADQQEYTDADGLPTDIFQLRRVEINMKPSQGDTGFFRAQPVTLDEVQRDLGATASNFVAFNRPVYYLMGYGEDTKLGFIPVPSESGTNNIKIWYVPELADLVLSTDEIKLPYPNRYYSLLGMYAANTLLSKGQQEEQASQRLLLRFEAGLQKMKQQLEERVADATKSVVETSDLGLYDVTAPGW